AITASMRLVNRGERDAVEVVQVYLRDPVASVVRPVQRLIGYRRVAVLAGQSVRVAVTVPIDLAGFTGRDLRRIVEPGDLELGFGRSSADIPLVHRVRVVGEIRELSADRAVHAQFQVVATA
ncbi:MAG: fibronectin type III-like domain-contianing protein, partial [Microcella sp.]|nr:fibronectin type III-like domain-contianing protein [Microcella sp.]